jgi:hypothetical protein
LLSPKLPLPHLSFSQLVLSHLSVAQLSHFSFATEVLGRVLRHRVSHRPHRMTLRLGRRRLSIVLVLLLVVWRSLGQVRNGQAVTSRRLGVVLMI